MTSYSDLVNIEKGNATTYGSHFKLSRLQSLEAVNALKKKSGKRRLCKILRVYIAGSMMTGNTHIGYFTTAIGKANLTFKDWEIEIFNLKDIRENEEWTHPRYLIEWLLESDFHVILCQGIHNGMLGLWNPLECQKQILRLQDHPGFPKGLNLMDPVISADKFEYLCAASQFCLPSFKLPLIHDNQQLNEISNAIKQFIDKFTGFDGEDCGFIIKAPFVQNQKGFKMQYFKTYEEFVPKLYSIYTKDAEVLGKKNLLITDVFPYLIVQPKVFCKNESKVILFDGKAQFICNSRQGLKKRKTRRELMDFAELACNYLKERTRNAFLCNGITRVDLFCTQNGQLQVNEYESLDANYGSSGKNESKAATMILEYYVNILSKLN